ncbi:MAG: hypothetical protein E6Q97_35570 [Desulfurellales bacterium]|nr:MAG: hypothetical protein E6Q97_35570 [Desulfurellales bacterium]
MILWHVAEVLRWESDRKQWELAAASHVWWGKAEQRKLWARARQGSHAGRKRKSVYDAVPTEERIGLIGSALSATKGAWAATHRRQMEWLRSQGVTPEEAVRRHREWLQKQVADPWFTPAKKRGG